MMIKTTIMLIAGMKYVSAMVVCIAWGVEVATGAPDTDTAVSSDEE